MITLCRRFFLNGPHALGTGPTRRGAGGQFIVAELPGKQTHFDSYILTLSDPTNIAHAAT